MGEKCRPVHIYFFPLMAPGHMIPLVDMARQFSRHKAKTTILLTNLNATQFSSSIERDKNHHGLDINIRQIKFPTTQVGLPENCQSLSSITTSDMSLKFDKALSLLQEPVHQLLKQDKPDCIVTDFFIPWATQVAEKLRIPRLVFHGAGFFPLCVYHSLIKYKPFESDSEVFTVPELPHVIKMSKRQVPDFITRESQNLGSKIFADATKAEETSYGVIFNSFKELEPDYVEHYRSKILIGRRKVWHVGPVSLCNKETEDKAHRVKSPTNTMAAEAEECLNWLNTQEPNSVVYVSFGTLSSISNTQLREIAIGLESSEQKFIWAVKYDEHNEVFPLPEEFEERIKDKGLVINGWVPQLMILEHESVGGFLTHCGWNSLLEGITAAVPMVTWPISSEQFENEKFLTEILKIGVGIGAQEWRERTDVNRVLIGSAKIAKAVRNAMIGEEAMEMRKRVSCLRDEAKKAVEVGGSSYGDIESLLEELRLNCNNLFNYY
ncbi:hypothetical protein RD792_016223 [Penstemon davidsonii]|uniref:Glycosyltransferase n=1 Tax=Penstemon davidsonii TaxID=160366 RepID=A0ABR0CKK2_9LAMI|nr:hypothetical protein RD792_016223 [Penstemon davidsonii]